MTALAGGGVLTGWAAVQADRALRENLMRQAQLVAQTVKAERVKELGGTSADMVSPRYQRLKDQLTAYKQTESQYRFIYLLGRRADGKIFFYVDSEPPASDSYSPPGQLYEEAPPGHFRIFKNGNPSTEGPYTDRWGSWVSALVPIHDPQAARPGLASTEDARGLVGKSVAFYRQNGRERLLKEVNDPNGAFSQGDLYAFVYDLGMTMQAHPVKPELVGRNQLDRKDWVGGTYFRREIQKQALESGSGWVDYEYENPVTRGIEPKTTYLERVDDLIICAGAYKEAGAVVAILGMDIDAKTWIGMVVRTALPTAIFTLVLTGILLGGAILVEKRARGLYTRGWIRHLEPAMAAGAGLVVTLFAAQMIRGLELRNRNEIFWQLATSRMEVLAKLLWTLRDTELEGLAHFLEHSERITPAEFERYAHYLSANPVVQAWEWAPAVPATERPQFEAAAGFGIWNKEAEGRRVPAADRTMYYPVTRVAPMSGNALTLGFDLGSEPSRRKALETSLETRLATATDPITLLQETGSQKGMLVYRPILGPQEGQMRGFSVAVLRMSTLLKAAAPDAVVQMELSLLSQGAAPEPLATSWDADSPPGSGLALKRPLFAFGKVFAMTAHAGPDFLRLYPVRGAWLTLLTGVLLSTAIAAILRVTLRRNENLEGLVSDRTRELRERETFQRLLLANLPAGIVIVDPVTRLIEEVNAHAATLFGASGDRLVGRRCHSLLCPAGEGACPVCDLHQELENADRVLMRADGSQLAILKTVKRILVDGREKYLECFVDVSARKRAEEAMERARDEAYAAVRARSQFLANMSHEIRTPMIGVLGMAELLSSTELTPEQRDHVEMINRSGDGLLSLLNDLLDFSKMEAGQLSLENTPFNLEHLVFDAAELFRPKIEGRPIELLVDFDPANPVHAAGDPGRLRQILNNLVSNAVKFTERGHILITVRSRSLDGARFHLTLAVSDTGIGISRENQGRLFQPFTQGDASTARRFGGTGLGLMIIKRLAEVMGGQVRLESQEGRGTVFTVEVDLGIREQPAEDRHECLELLGRRILLVDDLPLNLRLLTSQLGSQGAKTVEAASGAEALGLVRSALERGEPFDAAIVDLRMPGQMDGSDLGCALRADARCRTMALLALTATGVRGDAARLAEIGFDAYLVKPIRADLLYSAILMAMRRTQREEKCPLITRHTLSDARRASTAAPVQLEARILLVEDHETNQAVARKFLESAGATVRVAGNGSEALAMLARESFDVVLMDCQMPEMDGFEATARIRALEADTGRHLPIIAMTANALAGDRNRCLEAGMDDYLTKPIRRDTLLHGVARWLQGETPGMPETEAPERPAPSLVADPALELDADVFGNLLEAFGHDLRLLDTTVLQPFLAAGDERLAALERCSTEGDSAGVKAAAHALKGSSLALGFNALAETARQLEREAEISGGIDGTLVEARKGFALAQAFIQHMTGNGPRRKP